MSSDRLHPFSYVVLVLVGRGGAGPHDLRSYSERGRIFWDAAPSQWYAEPKRLAALGYLSARKAPGRTRERTVYELTEAGREAVAAWVATPSPLPRMQHESIARLLAADLADPGDIAGGLATLRDQIAATRAFLDTARERWPGLPHRAPLLEVNDRYARALLDAKLEWLEDAERVLLARRA